MSHVVSDLGLARKTFANISSTLSLLVSRLAAPSAPRLPSPSPAVALPDWHNATSLANSGAPAPASIGRSSTQCHQLAAILPDPWSACFASADRAFKFCDADKEVAEEEENIEDREKGQESAEER